jgi:hypothetical protein
MAIFLLEANIASAQLLGERGTPNDEISDTVRIRCSAADGGLRAAAEI